MMEPGRPIRVRRPSVLLIPVLLAVAVAPFPQSPATASCASPYLEVADRAVLERRSTVTVEGRAFTDGGCQDSMGCTDVLGCGSCTYDDPPAVPMEGVTLRLVQGDREWELAVTDAGSAEDGHLGWVSWTFDLPRAVEPGPARLLTGPAEPVRVRIR